MKNSGWKRTFSKGLKLITYSCFEEFSTNSNPIIHKLNKEMIKQ